MIGSQLTSTLTIVAFTVGLALLWLGWRGRKLDDRGEEIIIPNVPVVWEDAAASQPATSPHAN